MVLLKYNSVVDVNTHEEIEGFKEWCDSRGDCLYKDKTRKYHGWLHLDNLKEGKTIQCGYHSGNCDTRTLYGVGGYRNVCPIGGCNGDYPGPAKLQISDFNFDDYKITEHSTINKITVSFEHRMNGVSTVTGQAYYGPSNSPDFTSEAVKVYLTSDNEKISEEFTFDNPNNKSDEKFTGVSCTFNDISINDIIGKDFALNIEYNFNRNTNPGVIYLQNLSVNMGYKNSEAFIEGVSSTPSLYTSTELPCITTVHQTVKAGYKTNGKVISPSKAPKVLSSEIWCTNKSKLKNIEVKVLSTSNSERIFEITDRSGIGGKKYIEYALSSYPDKKVTLGYHATVRSKPSYKIVTKYKYKEDYDPKKSYVIFRNGCAPYIQIYVDSVKSTPIYLNVTNQNSSGNLLAQEDIETFHRMISRLSCGKHTLYIKRGNEAMADVRNNRVQIEVQPMNFKFRVYTDETEDKKLNFIQDKTNANRYSQILIKRIDDEPMAVLPQTLISDGTKPNMAKTYLTNFSKNETKTWNIDKYYAGKFKINLTPITCKNKKQTFNLTVNHGEHKQNYDYLFTRGEGGTAFDFDYLVAWEADDLKGPVYISNIEFSDVAKDIKICSNPVQTRISEIGLVELRIKNKRESESIKNLKIELNTLYENDQDILENTTNEWTHPNGLFHDFYNLFEEYNSSMMDNVEVLNLTPDNDLYEEENVYLFIKEIGAQDTVLIYLPFRSVSERTIYLQYLLFDKALKINTLESCSSNIDEEENDMIEVSVKDSMLTDLEIYGNTDLLFIDKRYPCPSECFTTVDLDENGDAIYDEFDSGGITYKITNIDTNDFSDSKFASTKIINDKELIPYGYIVDGHYYDLFNDQNERIEVQEERYMRDADGNILYHQQTNEYGEFIYDVETGNTIDDINDPIYAPNKINWIQDIEIVKKPMINYNIQCKVTFPQSDEVNYTIKTNKNGIANFFIPIPTSLNTSYTIKELLEEVLIFSYKGNDEYNPCILTDQNVLKPTVDNNKDETYLKYLDNFRRYKPGEVAVIPISLIVNSKVLQNYIIFNTELADEDSSDEVTILYRICNIPDNKGIFKTTFKTDDQILMKNQISKNIYCGLDTDIKVSTKIDKKIVENHNLNIINITIENQEKENHDVEIQIDLKKHLTYLGEYDFLDIDIEHGDYSIIKNDEENYISWLIGRMDPFEKENATIRIQAQEIGLSDIQVYCYDYLHQKGEEPKIINNNNCPECSDIKIRPIDSKWTEFDGIMYKLFDDGIYRRKINNEWVEKE